MEIKPEMMKLCYAIGQAIYPERTKIDECAEFVSKITGMSGGSASDYIKDFFFMREGKKISRCMKEDDAKYYFEKIFCDYGKDGLKNALSAFEKYLADTEQNHPGLEKLIEAFKKKL